MFDLYSRFIKIYKLHLFQAHFPIKSVLGILSERHVNIIFFGLPKNILSNKLNFIITMLYRETNFAMLHKIPSTRAYEYTG